MAVTISLYDHTANLIQSGTCIAGDTYKLILLNSSAVFDATHTTITAVTNSGAYEVYGFGWDQNGEPLSNVAISVATTNDSKFDADDVDVTASGGAIGPAYAALLVNSTDSKPLAYIDFGAAKQADDGTAFKVVWHASGIITLTVT